MRVGFKAYPCCHLSHAYLDCALRLRREHAIAASAIESVECRVPAGEVPIICEPRAGKLQPRTPYDAKFSLPYSVAAALVTGRVDLDTFAEDGLNDPAVLALTARVTHAVDDAPGYPERFPGWVRVRLRHGRVLEARQRDSSGGAEIPLPEAAIIEKFRACARRRLPRRGWTPSSQPRLPSTTSRTSGIHRTLSRVAGGETSCGSLGRVWTARVE